MNPAQLQAQATQAAAQGQQMLGEYRNNAANYQNQYNNYQGQADTANKNLQAYTSYMQNEGSPLNLYKQGISEAQRSMGFDPASLATATQNLTRSQNALNNVSQAAQSSTGGYGLSGAQLGNYYASAATPLSNQIQAQNNAVGNLQQLYQNALTQGQQGAQLGFQGEQQVSSNLNQTYQNAQNQAAQALNQMQFFSDLAQKQGGLNSQQANYYASALNAYRQSQAAIAQANLYGAQAAQAQAQVGLIGSQTAYQNMQNQAAQRALTPPAPANNSFDMGSLSSPAFRVLR